VEPVRVAVAGAGAFGKNHLRVLHELPEAQLVAVLETDEERSREASRQYGCDRVAEPEDLYGKVDAIIVATPTTTHSDLGCRFLEAGIDVLVEKPIAHSTEAAEKLVAAAQANNRILQVGHLERFNPVITALGSRITTPLFFEIHRMSEFSPRSLDVDVVLDLMIHDLEIVLGMTGMYPSEIRAAGISILSNKVDLANVRLAFPSGCIANLTASRVSTERIRKLRLFQPNQYISLDYSRQDGMVFTVIPDGEKRKIDFAPLPVTKTEPLKRQALAFLDSVRNRTRPQVSGEEGLGALRLATEILAAIEQHSGEVADFLKGWAAEVPQPAALK
jgi:predicted dehydrogenase